jgi:hypothetical protein
MYETREPYGLIDCRLDKLDHYARIHVMHASERGIEVPQTSPSLYLLPSSHTQITFQTLVKPHYKLQISSPGAKELLARQIFWVVLPPLDYPCQAASCTTSPASSG